MESDNPPKDERRLEYESHPLRVYVVLGEEDYDPGKG